MELALYNLIKNILSAINNKLLVGGVLYDLQKHLAVLTIAFSFLN
jgi:hypothetical protein